MPSVKLQPDTLALLSGLRGRFRCGHSYDSLIQELIRRHMSEINQALLATDRLQRIEEMLTRLVSINEDADHTSAPKKFTIE